MNTTTTCRSSRNSRCCANEKCGGKDFSHSTTAPADIGPIGHPEAHGKRVQGHARARKPKHESAIRIILGIKNRFGA